MLWNLHGDKRLYSIGPAPTKHTPAAHATDLIVYNTINGTSIAAGSIICNSR